jgi:hypothetical protein
MKPIPQEGELTHLWICSIHNTAYHQTKNAGFLSLTTTLLFLHSWDRPDDGY